MKLFIFISLIVSVLFSKEYTDMLARNVTVSNNQTLVCIGPGALRLAVYMGLENRIIGIEKAEFGGKQAAPYRMVMDTRRLAALPLIGQGGPGKLPNLEAVMRLKPALIVASFLTKEQLDALSRHTGIPVIAISYGRSYGGQNKKLEAIEHSLALLGEVFDKKERAGELIAFMKEQQRRLAALHTVQQPVYVGGISYKGVQGMLSTEAEYPPFAMLHLKNPLLQEQPFGHIYLHEEALLKLNPYAIFLDLVAKNIIDDEMQRHRAFYSLLEALKQHRVYWLLPSNFYNTNIENLYLNAWLVASHMGAKVDIKRNAIEVYEHFFPSFGKKLYDSFFPLPVFSLQND